MRGLGDAALIGREMVFAQAIDRGPPPFGSRGRRPFDRVSFVDSLGRVGQAYASSSSLCLCRVLRYASSRLCSGQRPCLAVFLAPGRLASAPASRRRGCRRRSTHTLASSAWGCSGHTGGEVLLVTGVVVVSCSSLRGLGWIQDRGIQRPGLAAGVLGEGATGQRCGHGRAPWSGADWGRSPGERARAGHDGEADPVNGARSRPLVSSHFWRARPGDRSRLGRAAAASRPS
jgi:hypothetical protein